MDVSSSRCATGVDAPSVTPAARRPVEDGVHLVAGPLGIDPRRGLERLEEEIARHEPSTTVTVGGGVLPSAPHSHQSRWPPVFGHGPIIDPRCERSLGSVAVRRCAKSFAHPVSASVTALVDDDEFTARPAMVQLPRDVDR